jgi:hypothetical protein
MMRIMNVEDSERRFLAMRLGKDSFVILKSVHPLVEVGRMDRLSAKLQDDMDIIRRCGAEPVVVVQYTSVSVDGAK